MCSYLIEIGFDPESADEKRKEIYDKFMKKYEISITGVNNGNSTLSLDSKKPIRKSKLEKDLEGIELKSFEQLC